MIQTAFYLLVSMNQIHVSADHLKAAVTAPIPPMVLSAIAQREIA